MDHQRSLVVVLTLSWCRRHSVGLLLLLLLLCEAVMCVFVFSAALVV